MRPSAEAHAAHLLRPVPTYSPWIAIFEGSAEHKSLLWRLPKVIFLVKKQQTAHNSLMKKEGRYRVRQGLGSEKQLNRESLQRATAEFIFPIFCPKLVFATSISTLPSPNTIVCHAHCKCVLYNAHVYEKLWYCLLNYLAALMWSNQVFLSLVELATSSYNWAPTC